MKRALDAAAFLARRAFGALVVVYLVVTATFFLNRSLPSDPARMIAGEQARPADVARIRTQLGLDRPVGVQYLAFLGRLVHFGPSHFEREKTPDHATCGHLGPLHFDLGRSYQQRKPVLVILGDRLPYTAALAFSATALAVTLGVVSGVLAALRRNTAVDATLVGLALLGVSAPTFLLGVAIQYLFAFQLELFPLNGAGKGLLDAARHLVLPTLTLGIFGAAFYTRLVRSEMIETLSADYVRTARAKGLSTLRVVVVHALRNVLVPLVTVVGLDLGALLGGAVLTEQIFSWPGVGALAVRAMRDRDGPVIMGTVLVSAIAIVALNLVVDFVYTFLDPRIRRARN